MIKSALYSYREFSAVYSDFDTMRTLSVLNLKEKFYFLMSLHYILYTVLKFLFHMKKRFNAVPWW